MALKAVSLFSNCGAGDVGYRAAGFQFEVMAEKDPRRLNVCLLNHPGASGVRGDLRQTWRRVVQRWRLRQGRRCPDLLAACPPCQGMSSAKHDRGSASDPVAGSNDPRNLLVEIIAKVAGALRPRVIVVENVQEFLTRQIHHPHTGNPTSAAKFIISELEPNYHGFAILTDLRDYGVPQTRRRTFLTLVRKDVPGLRKLLIEGRAPFPRPTHVPEFGGEPATTLRAALASFALPDLDARCDKSAKSKVKGNMHFVPVWNEHRYAMVECIPADSGKSAWENKACGRCGPVEVGPEEATCPVCSGHLLRPVTAGTDGKVRLITGFRSSSYRRMSPDRPAPTITTASGHIGSNLTIHPSQNRLLSPLECALLQTFPKNFVWGRAIKRWGSTNVRDMIGEAVPPRYTEMHGKVLREILTGTPGSSVPINASDPRCQNARGKLGFSDIKKRTL